jgi:ABC-2 type transport system permease protein
MAPAAQEVRKAGTTPTPGGQRGAAGFVAAEAGIAAPFGAGRPAAGVVLLATARRAIRSAALYGYVFGVVVASSAVSYTRLYKTPAERAHLAEAFGENHAAGALFGPAPDLQTVAGFTVFKSIMTLMVLGAIWGLLTGTRLLRGEEDAGRWELLVVGRAGPGRATAQALGGLGAGAVVLWMVTAVFAVAAGQYSGVDIGPGAALYFAVAVSATAVVFSAIGALTSQLAPTRRQAATYAAWFLGASYGVRMIADAGVGLHGLIWASPLGWVEQLRPLTSPQPLALLPIVGLTAIAGFAAVRLAAGRDLGASVLPDRAHSVPRLRLLFGQLGLTVRLVRPTATGWLTALAITGFVLGLIAKQAGGTISGSSVETVLSRLGATGTGARSFLGLSFLILAVLVAFAAAGAVTMARLEEAQGRLDLLLVRPVARLSWLAGRIGSGVILVVVGGMVAGIATWVGAVAQSAGVGFATLLGAGMNLVPPALCLLGIGVLALALWPRGSSYVVYTVLGWSLLVEVVGGIGSTSHWLLDTSLFHQMAAAPAVGPDWTAGAAMIGFGAVCAVAGGVAFGHRDLRGE